jgi:predicted amidophosphoribosyltransferase
MIATAVEVVHHHSDSSGTFIAIVLILMVVAAVAFACLAAAQKPGGVCPWCRRAMKPGAWRCAHCRRNKRPWMDWIAGPWH